MDTPNRDSWLCWLCYNGIESMTSWLTGWLTYFLLLSHSFSSFPQDWFLIREKFDTRREIVGSKLALLVEASRQTEKRNSHARVETATQRRHENFLANIYISMYILAPTSSIITFSVYHSWWYSTNTHTHTKVRNNGRFSSRFEVLLFVCAYLFRFHFHDNRK